VCSLAICVLVTVQVHKLLWALQLIPIRTSAEFDSHSSASSVLALTRHHTHIHTPRHTSIIIFTSIQPLVPSHHNHLLNCISAKLKYLSTSSVPIMVKHFLPPRRTPTGVLYHFHRYPTAGSFAVHCSDLPHFLSLSNASYCVSTRPCTFLLTFINIPQLVPTHDFFNPIL